MSDLYRLVYASKNFVDGSEAEIAQAITQILEASQRNNAKVDVTGALMFNGGAFAQVLEGPRRGVESTFERIQRDTRHGDVTVLQCGPAESRGFANWSMGFVGQSPIGQALWDDIAAESGFDLSRLDGDAVFAMLHGLVLEEEGLPMAGSALPQASAIAAQSHVPLDVERIRAELPLLGQVAPPVMGPTAQSPSRELPPRAAQTPVTANGEKTDAVLAVFRSALAAERQLTTELRNELDELRAALAQYEAQARTLQQERDLWAKRAKLLATALGQEASEVTETSLPAVTARLAQTLQNHPRAPFRTVA